MSADRPFLIFAAALWLAGASPVSAQSETRRVELGAALTFLRQSTFDETTVGVAGRFTYSIADWIAADVEVGFTPHDDVVVPTPLPELSVRYFRRRVEVAAGPKIGLRRDSVGVYGRIRPGFTRLSDEGVGCIGQICALVLLARPVYRTEPMLDLGGGVEFFLFDRTITRIDLGDTIVGHRSITPPCQDCSTHNFAARLGLGIRF